MLEVRRIWEAAPHNAFTDLVWHGDEWVCVFREGENHVSDDGALRVIASPDGEQWSSAALLTSAEGDLRDAKITITPSGELMLGGAVRAPGGPPWSFQSLVWFSRDGRSWSDPVMVGDHNFWMWRTTWHRGAAYNFGYDCGEGPRSLRLYRSYDGGAWETLVERLELGAYPNETQIAFADDTAYCLLRRDPDTGLIGTAEAPYTDWSWQDLGVRIGGPALLRLPDGRLVGCVRRYYDEPRYATALGWIDPVAGRYEEFLELPSAGDTSYAGLVWKDERLWVSYYSSHEGKTSIYLARVELA